MDSKMYIYQSYILLIEDDKTSGAEGGNMV